MHSNDENIKLVIIQDIQDKLRAAWNNAREVDVESELSPFKNTYEDQKNTEIENAKRIALQTKQSDLRDSEEKYKIDLDIKKSQLEREALAEHKPTYSASQTAAQNLIYVKYSLSLERSCRDNDIERNYQETIQKSTKQANTSYTNNCVSKRQQLVQKYNDIFTHTWSSTYLPQFQAQFTAFDIVGLRAQFLQRHPWLTTQLIERHALIDKFLQEVIETSFWQCLTTRATKTSWRELDLQYTALNWSRIDPNWLREYIQSCPLQDSSNYLLHTFPSWVYNFYLTSGNLSRQDLYHLSINNSGFNPVRCIGATVCISILPEHISKIPTFSSAERNKIEFLFINVSTEENPVWILLHRKYGINTLYLPKGISIGTYDENLLIDFQPITKVEVDLSKHFLANEYSVTNLAIWHAALVTRVFAWCKLPDSGKPDLANYRDSLPALMLIEGALRNVTPNRNNRRINVSFANRAPYSGHLLDEYYRKDELHSLIPAPANNLHLLDDWKVLPDNLDIGRILSQFDNKSIRISKSSSALFRPDTLVIDTDLPTIFFHAIKLSEHHGFSRLELSNRVQVSSVLENNTTWQYKLVTTNLSVTTVIPLAGANLASHKYLYHCAARNRFIKVISPNYLSSTTDILQARKKIWSETGKLVLDLFKQNKFNLDDIKDVIGFNKIWRLQHCANEFRTPNDKTWRFVQLAQMGCQGLDVFFDKLKETYVNSWDATYQEVAPDLNCTFDLQGSLAETPLEYIKKLTSKIKDFGNGDTCAPLFKNLKLIIPELSPDSLVNNNIYQEIRNLILALHERRKKYPNDICEVELYNIDISNQLTHNLIDLLQRDAEDINIRLQISIKVPDWDRESFKSNQAYGARKAKYRNLQNHVENNLRFARYPSLRANTQAILDYKDGRIRPQIEIENRDAQLSQIWDGADVEYPLTAESPGIQQQLQQQIARAHTFEKAKKLEAVKEKEVIRQVSQYGGNERELITRSNIESRCRAYWNSLPEKTLNLSGINQTDTLDKFFSLVVGSDFDSSFVIEQIHPLAMDKIMDFAPNFKDGIDWEHTPGFEVRYSSKGKYILTFDDRKEKQDLMAQKDDIARNKRSPFARQLKKPKAADILRGDYRQFATFVSNPGNYESPNEQSQQHLQACWTHLATEDSTDIERNNHLIANAQSIVRGSLSSVEESSAILAT